MYADATALFAAFAGTAGFGLGHVAAWPRLRRIRTDLSHARYLAEHDPLTGLPNRAGAQRHYAQQVAADRPPLAVLLDLDGFKTVNDTWGHQAGDTQLCAVADRLTAACTPIGAFAARLAGDEFLLLLPKTHPDLAQRNVATILAQLSAPLNLPTDDTTTITSTPSASAGIALPEPDTTWTDLLRRADIALYHAKTQRGQAVLYAFGMFQPAPDDTYNKPHPHQHKTTRRQRSHAQASELAVLTCEIGDAAGWR